jgi:hypothetical protein
MAAAAHGVQQYTLFRNERSERLDFRGRAQAAVALSRSGEKNDGGDKYSCHRNTQRWRSWRGRL